MALAMFFAICTANGLEAVMGGHKKNSDNTYNIWNAFFLQVSIANG